MELHSNYFYGNEVSDYGKKNKRVDYETLCKAFDCVMSNDIMQVTNSAGLGEWIPENGSEEYYEDVHGNILMPWEAEKRVEELEDELVGLDEDKDFDKIEEIGKEIDRLQSPLYHEVFQFFIISPNGADILREWTNELVWYNEKLNLYLWGVTHWGTSWDYVLTDIVINTKEEE